MGLLEEPRYVLNNVCNNFFEMPENTIREQTFCCGGGAGLGNDENMEMRLRGGLPRGNAVKYVREKHGVNLLALHLRHRPGDPAAARASTGRPGSMSAASTSWSATRWSWRARTSARQNLRGEPLVAGDGGAGRCMTPARSSPGSLVFVVLATSPLWYNALSAASPDAPELAAADQRGDRVRRGDRVHAGEPHGSARRVARRRWCATATATYVSEPTGKDYEMSLTDTCMDCHANKAQFCDACHNYVGGRSPTAGTATWRPRRGQ